MLTASAVFNLKEKCSPDSRFEPRSPAGSLPFESPRRIRALSKYFFLFASLTLRTDTSAICPMKENIMLVLL